jgi:hypothetical protein
MQPQLRPDVIICQLVWPIAHLGNGGMMISRGKRTYSEEILSQ